MYPIVQFVLNLTTFICSSVHPLPAQVSVQFPNQCSAYQINSCISILPCLLNLDSMNVPISPPYPAASLHNQEWSPLVILINFSNIIHFTQTLYHVFLQQLSLISTYFLLEPFSLRISQSTVSTLSLYVPKPLLSCATLCISS